MTIPVRIFRLEGFRDLPLPRYAESGASGMDCFAAVGSTINLAPKERVLVPLGFAIEIPDGYEGQIRGRSGLALKSGLGIVQGVGTIDSSYRGVVGALIVNHSRKVVQIRRSDRICQLVIAPVVRAQLLEVEDMADLSVTDRAAGGFGSTGQGSELHQPNEIQQKAS
jgi:dUTP pyrophosphatase